MTTAELEELLVPDAAGWRDWLASHHDSSPGVWLVLTKKGGTSTDLRFTRRGPRSNWSFSNVQRVERLESEDRMRPAGRAAVEAAKADGRWDAAYEREASK